MHGFGCNASGTGNLKRDPPKTAVLVMAAWAGSVSSRREGQGLSYVVDGDIESPKELL